MRYAYTLQEGDSFVLLGEIELRQVVRTYRTGRGSVTKHIIDSLGEIHGPGIVVETIAERLEYLRSQIRAECISYGEIAELESLSDYIEPGDADLLEWAGVSEEEARDTGRI